MNERLASFAADLARQLDGGDAVPSWAAEADFATVVGDEAQLPAVVLDHLTGHDP